MKITLFTGSTEYGTFHCEAGTPLKDALVANNIAFHWSLPCGGNGICGKCRAEVCLPGKQPQTVLACQYVLTENCVIRLPEISEEYSVVTESHFDTKAGDSIGNFGIAIDIGTTTLAMQLFQLGYNNVPQILNTHTCTNPQRIYGADVLSRIQSANNGNLKKLTSLIKEALSNGLKQLLQEANVPVSSIVIAGNSSMIYFLMGYPCDTLGQFPFTAPLTTKTISLVGADIFPDVAQIADADITILPGVSAFIGGDIIAGLLACQQKNPSQNALFIDLGTNGEIALVTKDSVFCTSAAAGPAFEGVNISCGIGSVPDAIAHVTFNGTAENISLQTISGSAAPTGLCGSGLLDAIAGLLTLPIPVLDETGLLADPYFENGVTLYSDANQNITLIQKDIRELQLAKSAVRTGIEILLKRNNLTYDNVDCVYIAGGFGSTLSINSAAAIGLIPKELSAKTVAVGNTSLAGAINYLANKKETEDFIRTTTGRCTEITLASDPDFQEYFLEYINFPV